MSNAVEIHGPGHFDNSGRKKYAVTVGGELLHSEDGWGHKRLRTFPTKAGAEKAAAEVRA